MKWNLKSLRDKVEYLYGEDQRNILSSCLESVVYREYYARFHYQEAKQLVFDFLSTRNDFSSLAPLVFGGTGEDQIEFRKRCVFAEAHVISCLQSIHSLYDIMSHVIYYSLGMNKKSECMIRENMIGIKSVYKKLVFLKMHKKISDEIYSTINNDNFNYLSAIVNHSKHRSIINLCFTVDIGDPEKDLYEFNFNSFVYSGVSYLPRSAFVFIDEEYERCSKQINSIGRSLNYILRCDL